MNDETLATQILRDLPLVNDHNGGKVQYLVNALREVREACAKIAEKEPVVEFYCVGRENRTVESASATKRNIAAKIRAGRLGE